MKILASFQDTNKLSQNTAIYAKQKNYTRTRTNIVKTATNEKQQQILAKIKNKKLIKTQKITGGLEYN